MLSLVRAQYDAPSLCEGGGIGRRTRLRIWRFDVRVQVPPLAPHKIVKVLSIQDFFLYVEKGKGEKRGKKYKIDI